MKMRLWKAVFAMVLLACLPSFSFAEDVIRVGILKFESKANGISYSNAESITDELTRMLSNSYSIAIIDRSTLEAVAREHRMNLAGLIDPRTAAQLGHVAGIQYLLTGAITSFGLTESVEQNDTTALWNLIGGKDWAKHMGSKTIAKTENAELTLDVRIIDVNTQEVVLSMAETGKATRTTTMRADNTNSGSANVQNTSLRDEAVSDAVARIGQRIKEAVAGEYPQVLRVTGGEIILSLGAKSGAKVGNLYKISFEGEDILDMRGKVIGKTTTPIAVVRVEDVKNDYSTARVIKKGGNPSNVQRGDRIEPSSSNEASDLIKRKAFPERRPRKTLGESGLEGAELDSRLNSIASEQTQGANQYTSGSQQVRTASITLENESTNASEVIESYAISDADKRSLKDNHKRAEAIGSNKGKFKRYTDIFARYPSDYFAAYQASKTALSMGRKSSAKEWAEKALSVNPNYEPAKKILQSAKRSK